MKFWLQVDPDQPADLSFVPVLGVVVFGVSITLLSIAALRLKGALALRKHPPSKETASDARCFPLSIHPLCFPMPSIGFSPRHPLCIPHATHCVFPLAVRVCSPSSLLLLFFSVLGPALGFLQQIVRLAALLCLLKPCSSQPQMCTALLSDSLSRTLVVATL
jgi:hypothetical protein